MFRFIWRILRILTLLLIIGIASMYAVLQYYSADLPSYQQLENYNPPSVTRIYSADGKLMEEYAKENRVFVAIENIPTSLIQAFIAAEDKNFYQHQGIDLYALLRASIKSAINIVQNKRVEGGSTITQQVVKIFLLGPERSLSRKIKEAILSFKISRVYSKDKILELYLNQTFLGQGAYGVASAANKYFNKSLEDLDLSESALLAALPKFPSILNSSANYDKAKNRRNYVIQRMLEDGYIGMQAAQEAIISEIKFSKPLHDEYLQTGYYCEKVRNQVIQMLGEDTFYNGGLSIITTLDSKYQEAAQQAFIQGIRKYDQSNGFCGPITRLASLDNWSQEIKNYNKEPRLLEYQAAVVLEILKDKVQIGLKNGLKNFIHLNQMKWARSNLIHPNQILKQGDIIAVSKNQSGYELKQIPKVDGATILMNVESGKVLAMISGYDFKSSKFDRASQAQRQPGSLIKPLVYLAALEQGIEPNTIFQDQPIEIDQGYGMPPYKPKNFNNNYLGPITMRSGLELSRNTITVQIAQLVGLEKIAQIIKRFGINDNPQHFYSMALGSLETTLDKITSAYGSIANGCRKITPHFIEMIKDRNGNIIYRRDQRSCKNCLAIDVNNASLPSIIDNNPEYLSDQISCYQITSMMQGVVERGTARSATKLGKVLAGKTGTSNDSKDTWFVGFTPQLVIGIYVGFDQPKNMGQKATGSSVALPIFINMMEHEIFKKQPSLEFMVPANVHTIKINPKTGIAEHNQDSQNAEIIEVLKHSYQIPSHNHFQEKPEKSNDQYPKNDNDPFEKIKDQTNALGIY